MNKGFLIVFIVFLFGHERKCDNQFLENLCKPTEEQLDLVENGVFYCLNHIKEVCREQYSNDVDMQSLLNIFNVSRVAVMNRMRRSSSVKCPPRAFINIESVYSSKRTYICKKVARHFYAKYVLSPPKFLYEERKRFTERKAKRIFYSLSKYSSSFHVKSFQCTHPVVLERYWLDHATFSIAKKYEDSPDIPPATSTIYNWPVDLLKPDIVFFINGSRSMEDIGFEYNNFTERFTNVLRQMKGVKVVEIDPHRNPDVIIKDIIRYIEARIDTDFKNLFSFNQTRSYRRS